jgi:two-component system KDP operon response regulator KdpE
VARHLAKRRGDPIHLTPTEFKLLHVLMANLGKAIPHARLLVHVWGPEYGRELEYLRTFVRSLRKKIEDDPATPRYLLTEPHFGYRLNEPA